MKNFRENFAVQIFRKNFFNLRAITAVYRKLPVMSAYNFRFFCLSSSCVPHYKQPISNRPYHFRDLKIYPKNIEKIFGPWRILATFRFADE